MSHMQMESHLVPITWVLLGRLGTGERPHLPIKLGGKKVEKVLIVCVSMRVFFCFFTKAASLVVIYGVL